MVGLELVSVHIRVLVILVVEAILISRVLILGHGSARSCTHDWRKAMRQLGSKLEIIGVRQVGVLVGGGLGIEGGRLALRERVRRGIVLLHAGTMLW